MPDDTVLLGIDIGGTKIGVCIGTAAGAVLHHETFATPPDAAPTAVVAEALRRLQRARGDRPAAALGCACPGPMSSREGRFLDPPNMPRWHDYGLLAELAHHVDVPAAMMNDANAGALAEWLWGAARDTTTAVFVTMSTGMGAGLILDGRLYEGPDDLAGEIGHIRLAPDGPVGFGKRGSVEGFLSGPGMVQVAEAERLAARQIGAATALHNADPLTPQALCTAAHVGDVVACRAIERVATALGRLAALLTDLLNPDVIVLGTIGTAWPHLFIPRATEVLRAEAIGRAADRVRIVPSGLGEHRGPLAAIAVARHALGAPSQG